MENELPVGKVPFEAETASRQRMKARLDAIHPVFGSIFDAVAPFSPSTESRRAEIPVGETPGQASERLGKELSPEFRELLARREASQKALQDSDKILESPVTKFLKSRGLFKPTP